MSVLLPMLAGAMVGLGFWAGHRIGHIKAKRQLLDVLDEQIRQQRLAELRGEG